MMDELGVPQDLVDFLAAGRQLEYDPKGCECGAVTLKGADDLALGSIRVWSDVSHPDRRDPNRGRRGAYEVPAVDLVGACRSYDPHGLLVWLPAEQAFAVHDSDHGEAREFPGATWGDIVADPPRYLGVLWDGRRSPGRRLRAWERHAFVEAPGPGAVGAGGVAGTPPQDLDDPRARKEAIFLAEGAVAILEWEDADRRLQPLVERCPHDGLVRRLAGEVALKRRRREEALAHFEAAIAARPGDTLAWLYVADGRAKAKDHPAAEAAWARLGDGDARSDLLKQLAHRRVFLSQAAVDRTRGVLRRHGLVVQTHPDGGGFLVWTEAAPPPKRAPAEPSPEELARREETRRRRAAAREQAQAAGPPSGRPRSSMDDPFAPASGEGRGRKPVARAAKAASRKDEPESGPAR